MRFRTKIAVLFIATCLSMSYLPEMIAGNTLGVNSISKMSLNKLTEMSKNKNQEWFKEKNINYNECEEMFLKNNFSKNEYKKCQKKINEIYIDYLNGI